MNRLHSVQKWYLKKLMGELLSNDVKLRRSALSRSITLIESGNVNGTIRRQYGQLKPNLEMNCEKLRSSATCLQLFMDEICSKTSKQKRTIRLGFTGAPGAGKSTFIDSFGSYLSDEYSLKVAVLTIDPSSDVGGGSILGDKTRMSSLSIKNDSFIRSSPSKNSLGGIAPVTYETILLCEAARYDIVLIESVGVGQSESEIRDVSDFLLLLVPPGSGDNVQGIKKGIMEHIDGICVTKSDGDLIPSARRTYSEYQSAIRLYSNEEKNIKIFMTSAKKDEGMENLWNYLNKFSIDQLTSIRQEQKTKWFRRHFLQRIVNESKEFLSTNHSKYHQVVGSPYYVVEEELNRFMKFLKEKK
ncbi:hypothetical protein SNEBB_006989 [Seison nebaliae]|nr:hypothetical protein SNEBB_006989 [Seison nebaliae]